MESPQNSILKITIIFFILIVGFGLNAQNKRYHDRYTFRYITVDEGLPDNRVRGLVQDDDGFMWFGTRSGICKYDGITLKNYLYYWDDTTRTIISSTRTMVVDKQKRLWVGGDYGACLYNEDEDRFEKFKDPAGNEDVTRVFQIAQDSKGILWFTNRDNIFNVDPVTFKVTSIKTDANDPGSLPEGHPERILVDGDDNIWIGYQKRGLAFFDRKQDVFKHYTSSSDSNSLGEDRVECLYLDDNGVLWIGHNNNGVSKYNKRIDSFERLMPDPEHKESGRVRGLLKDNKGNFWIGTQFGLYIYDEIFNKFSLYASTKHPISELSHNSIQTMCLDNQEGLWLGTFAGGVDYTNLINTGFIKYSYNKFNDSYHLNDKNVYSLAIDNNGYVWVGTENGGLNKLDRLSGKFEYFVNDPHDLFSIPSNNIKEIEVDSDNNLWVATYGGGLSYYNSTENRFFNLLNISGKTMFPEKNIYSVELDPLNTNKLWVGTNNGLYTYNITDSSYNKINADNEEYFNAPDLKSQISRILKYKNEKLLIGANSLYVLDLNTNVFNKVEKAGDLIIENVAFVFVDRLGFIWFISANKYLIRANSFFTEFNVFEPQKDIPTLTYLDCTDDEQGNLWCSTNKGLVKFENIVNQQDSVRYKIFSKADNLQSQEFLYRSKATSSDGEIMFGGISGFNSFYPEFVTENEYPPQIVITGLKVDGKYVGPNVRVHGKIIMSKHISEAEKIRIHHRIKLFSVEFAGLHYVAPDQNKYKYMLDGYDKDWIYADASVRYASYSNLPLGTYTFKIAAANKNNVWSEVKSFEIKVTPPLWKRWWFILIVLLGVVILIRALLKLRERRALADKKNLELELQRGKDEIKQKIEQIEQQQKEIMAKEESEAVHRFFNEGLALFSEILSRDRENMDTLLQKLVVKIANYIQVEQAGFFISNDIDREGVYLELAASHAFNIEKLKNKKIYPGEGQVGLCFKENRIIQLDNLPETYSKLSSGLGEVSISNILLLPVQIDNNVLGVLELSSFKKIPQNRIDFLMKLSENIASTIYALKSSIMIKQMLANSEEQTEELHAQEEELRQNMEEMQATQEELKRQMQTSQEMQKELEISKTLMDALMTNLPDFIYFKDKQSKFLRISLSMLPVFPVDNIDEMIGKSDFDFHDREVAQKYFDDEKKIMDTGTPLLDDVVHEVFGTGVDKWVSTTKMPLYTESGAVVGTFGITKDITAVKKLELEADKLNKELQLKKLELEGIIKDLKAENNRLNKKLNR